MSQLELALIARIHGPSVVPQDEVLKIQSFRDAVVACWVNRRVKGMTKATLAERTGMRPSHITDYLSPAPLDENGRERRDMPGKYVPGFEEAMGNCFVSQWFAMRSQLPIREVLPEERQSA